MDRTAPAQGQGGVGETIARFKTVMSVARVTVMALKAVVPREMTVMPETRTSGGGWGEGR
jgi:hypothetical protein